MPVRKKIGLLATILSILLLFSFSLVTTQAQTEITVLDQGWNAEFRDHLTFTLEVESSAEIVEADLFYQIVGQIATSRNEADFTPGTSVSAEFVIDQTEPGNYSPPGTRMLYWWKIVDAAGNELKTEKEELLYLDNRYEWQTLQNERVTLYWYVGDDAFGQELFDRANEALDRLETDIGIALSEPISIFIYGNHDDLLGALRASAQEWTGGVAFSEFGVVIIGVHPRQLEWGLNAMTHEMTHLVIHQATDNPFGDLPRWLDEGIAVYNENRDELDQDFKPFFNRAVADDALMTLRTLSSPFPGDPLQANLAYGQSGEVVRYIINTYGSDAMSQLLEIFSEGALYDEALEEALGVNTDQLDNDFRLSLGLPPLPGIEASQPEAETVEEPTPEPTEESQAVAEESSEAVTTEESVPEPTQPAPTEETASTGIGQVDTSGGEEPLAEVAESQPEQESSPLSGLPCISGIMLLGIAVVGRRLQYF